MASTRLITKVLSKLRIDGFHLTLRPGFGEERSLEEVRENIEGFAKFLVLYIEIEVCVVFGSGRIL